MKTLSPAGISTIKTTLAAAFASADSVARREWAACEAIDARLVRSGQMSRSALRRAHARRAEAAEHQAHELSWALVDLRRALGELPSPSNDDRASPPGWRPCDSEGGPDAQEET